MTSNAGTYVTVGHVRIPLPIAEKWVCDYTNVEKNTSSDDPYAYPAYDQYEQESNNPLQLADADLLAPALLNVPPKIRTYYDLQQIRGTLEKGLANEDLAKPLAAIDNPDRIAGIVRPLYGVLDDTETKPWGVGATLLSKVLHRKRPQSLVLHDKWVRACYVGDRKPVPLAKLRSWADYMIAVTTAIGEDIRTQQEAFVKLDAATGTPGRVSHVRLLDILAWKSRGVAWTAESNAATS